MTLKRKLQVFDCIKLAIEEYMKFGPGNDILDKSSSEICKFARQYGKFNKVTEKEIYKVYNMRVDQLLEIKD